MDEPRPTGGERIMWTAIENGSDTVALGVVDGEDE